MWYKDSQENIGCVLGYRMLFLRKIGYYVGCVCKDGLGRICCSRMCSVVWSKGKDISGG